MDDVNRYPWRLGYKLIMQKLGARPPPPNLEKPAMTHFVNSLFPTHDELPISRSREDIEGLENFSRNELRTVAKHMKNNKAPGPDGFPSEIMKIIAKKKFNFCLMEGLLPSEWKIQKLVLISKGKGNSCSPPANRPLCMLNTAGKLLEKMLKPRLASAIENAGGLSHDRRCGQKRRK